MKREWNKAEVMELAIESTECTGWNPWPVRSWYPWPECPSYIPEEEPEKVDTLS